MVAVGTLFFAVERQSWVPKDRNTWSGGVDGTVDAQGNLWISFKGNPP
jgi:hypothetical protein